ncbi:glutathione S-transferase family protein [Colwelliaceae bacterium 6441]
MQLVIGNQNYSSWSLRPWVLLEHFKQQVQLYKIPLFTHQTQEKMAQLCPNYKVPVLIDNNIKIWDSLAICEYLNESYLAGKAWPENTSQRAIARSICAEMHAGFIALRSEMPMNCRRTPSVINYSEECQKDIDRIIELWQTCLDNSKSKFLFDTFSIADAFYLPVVSRFASYQVEVPEKIKTYMDTMMSLPSYQLWLTASIEESEVISSSEV